MPTTVRLNPDSDMPGQPDDFGDFTRNEVVVGENGTRSDLRITSEVGSDKFRRDRVTYTFESNTPLENIEQFQLKPEQLRGATANSIKISDPAAVAEVMKRYGLQDRAHTMDSVTLSRDGNHISVDFEFKNSAALGDAARMAATVDDPIFRDFQAAAGRTSVMSDGNRAMVLGAETRLAVATHTGTATPSAKFPLGAAADVQASYIPEGIAGKETMQVRIAPDVARIPNPNTVQQLDRPGLTLNVSDGAATVYVEPSPRLSADAWMAQHDNLGAALRAQGLNVELLSENPDASEYFRNRNQAVGQGVTAVDLKDRGYGIKITGATPEQVTEAFARAGILPESRTPAIRNALATSADVPTPQAPQADTTPRMMQQQQQQSQQRGPVTSPDGTMNAEEYRASQIARQQQMLAENQARGAAAAQAVEATSTPGGMSPRVMTQQVQSGGVNPPNSALAQAQLAEQQRASLAASDTPVVDRRSPDSVGAQLRGSVPTEPRVAVDPSSPADGLYRPEGQVYHGTSRAYDTIRLPDADSDLARHGMDEYGRGFYAAFDPQNARDAQNYAARYTEGAGLVVEGSLDRSQAFLNLESPLGDGLSQQLRTQLNHVETGNPELDRYYRDVAAQLDPAMSGREAWERISGSQVFEQWQHQQNTVEIDRATATKLLRADRAQLRAGLETHGIDLSEISALDAPQAQRVQESLRALNTDNPVMQRYFNDVADQVKPGMDTDHLNRLLSNEVGVQRTAASMVPEIDIKRITALMDGQTTQILSGIGADGVYIPSQQTLVFKGQSAIDQLPELRIAEIVGTGPVSGRIHTDRPLAVGEVMIPAGAAHPSQISAIDTSPEAYARATTPEARAAILNARVENTIPSTPDRAVPFPAPDQFGRPTTQRNGLSTDPLVYTERSNIERLPPLDMDGLQRDLRAKGQAALEEAGMTRTPPEAFGRRGIEDAGPATAVDETPPIDKPRPKDPRVAELAARAGDKGVPNPYGLAQSHQPQLLAEQGAARHGGGSTASLGNVAEATTAAPQVGQAAIVEQRSTSQLRPQVEPTYSSTAAVAANDGKSGQAMTDAVDAAGRNSAAPFMPKANGVPNAANDGPSVAAASPAEQEPVSKPKRRPTVIIEQTAEDIAFNNDAARAAQGASAVDASPNGKMGGGSQALGSAEDIARAEQAAITRAAASNGAVDATQAALHAYNELGQAGRMGALLRRGGQKIPLVGAAIAGGFGAYALYNAERGYDEGKLTEPQINAVRAALAPYVMTQAGSIVTGLAGEEAIDAGLVAAGVPAEYRLGTLRDAIASGAQAAIDAHDFSERKASIPQPTVDAFITALRNERGQTQDAALNDYFEARDKALLEGREGRIQSATSQARFGNLPRSHVSQEEVNARITDAARTYLAYGGNIDTAMAALSDDPARARLEGQITDILKMVPSRHSKEAVYPSNSEHLERLRDLTTQRAASSDATERDTLLLQMRTEAANYLGQGKDARDALFAYYRGAPFGVAAETREQIAAHADMRHAFDGADGSKRDGVVSLKEIGQKLANMGVYTSRIDANRDGEASFQELQAVYRNPEAFKDRER